jgi:hypothetical protein
LYVNYALAQCYDSTTRDADAMVRNVFIRNAKNLKDTIVAEESYLVPVYKVCKPEEYQYEWKQVWCHRSINKTKQEIELNLRFIGVKTDTSRVHCCFSIFLSQPGKSFSGGRLSMASILIFHQLPRPNHQPSTRKKVAFIGIATPIVFGIL